MGNAPRRILLALAVPALAGVTLAFVLGGRREGGPPVRPGGDADRPQHDRAPGPLPRRSAPLDVVVAPASTTGVTSDGENASPDGERGVPDAVAQRLRDIPVGYRRLTFADTEASNPHLSGRATIVGRVVDGDGKPIPDAVVVLSDPNDPDGGLDLFQLARRRGARTDAAGTYTIANAAVFRGSTSGHRLYCVVRSGATGTHRVSHAVVLRVGPPLSEDFSVVSRGSASVAGRVDLSGPVPADCSVWLVGSSRDHERIERDEALNADGTFHFRAVPSGEFALELIWPSGPGGCSVSAPAPFGWFRVAKNPVLRNWKSPIAMLRVRWAEGEPRPDGGKLMVYTVDDDGARDALIATIVAGVDGTVQVWLPMSPRLRYRDPWTQESVPLELRLGAAVEIVVRRPSSERPVAVRGD